MKTDKFIITNLIKNLIYHFDTYLTNFPHEYIELKKTIMNTSYDMLKLAYEANHTYNINKRIDLQDKMISYVKYLDFLINSCYDKKIINSKKYVRFGEDLDNLLQYLFAWRNKTRA